LLTAAGLSIDSAYLPNWARQAALIERIYLRRQASTFSVSGTS
jgi:hypothetical protein